MAERLNKRHQQFVRDKIQASQLVNRLTNHALGKEEMTATQVRAAEVLLKKSVPDLSATELSGPNGGPVEGRVVFEFVKPESKG
jgi:hypothetical protein